MSNVCSTCIGDRFKQEQVVNEGVITDCDFCRSKDTQTMELEVLAKEIHTIFENHFWMTSPEPEGFDVYLAREGRWEQPGDPISHIIGDLLESDNEDLISAICEYLFEEFGPAGSDALIDPAPYDGDSLYIRAPIKHYEFQESWDSLRQEITHHARFFNKKAEAALEHLFHGVGDLETPEGSPVIRVLSSNTRIFRARLAKTYLELPEIIKSVPVSLGSPPEQLATAGRMNPEGISVFYGATDANTCISEIRPAVGSYVVIGQFYPLRDLRVLDLSLLQDVCLPGSFFDQTYSERLSRISFLGQLVEELSRPIMPGEEARGYLLTQVVSEYLANHAEIKLDGIMFNSSQVTIEEKGESEEVLECQNIVLFPHACIMTHQVDKLDIYMYPEDPSDPRSELDISILKIPSSETEGGPLTSEEGLNPSIQLDVESIEIKKIQGVRYQA
ncbi:RES domain-containing protein [Microbulbifer sp. VAAF005]|uniref:RES domain-containing protein n=1 Tax=Microbulbifer sp. VAAF005 TaxID=3034230 RepID=UPI0024ADE312|nr:RES domain-containing protein [Microbulbifer sp. VAAF005]WHI48959.1 RES domain-containing protein [Microbulbifer sp. VAAF005]